MNLKTCVCCKIPFDLDEDPKSAYPDLCLHCSDYHEKK